MEHGLASGQDKLANINFDTDRRLEMVLNDAKFRSMEVPNKLKIC
jgi:hypothetical protein